MFENQGNPDRESTSSEEASSSESNKRLESPASSHGGLSSPSQTRIRAGIMETHARFLNTPDSEWRSYFCEAFDVFAGEMLNGARNSEVLLEEVIPRLVSDEAIRHRWLRPFHGTAERDTVHATLYGSFWVDPSQIRFLKRTLEGSALRWRAKQLFLHGETSVPEDSPKAAADITRSRRELLTDYKHRTGVRTNAAIYNARNSGVHKPDFYRWLSGKLPAATVTAGKLENFLRAGELPRPRKVKP